MIVSKRSALGISLGAIVLYWIYQIASQQAGAPLPAHFSELVWRIVRTKLLVFVALYLLLRLEGEGFKELGLSGHQWPKHLGLGLLFGLGMFFALNVALGAVMQSLLPRRRGTGLRSRRFSMNRGTCWPGSQSGSSVEAWWRNSSASSFSPASRNGWGVPASFWNVLSSLMFGLGHRYQGLGIAISTAVSGAIFALVYLRRRSALEPIAAHAFSDVLAMLVATMHGR